jgi:hypothetical protein
MGFPPTVDPALHRTKGTGTHLSRYQFVAVFGRRLKLLVTRFDRYLLQCKKGHFGPLAGALRPIE